MSAGYIPFHPNPSEPKYKPTRGRSMRIAMCSARKRSFPTPRAQVHALRCAKEKLFRLRDFLGFDKNVIVAGLLPQQGQSRDGGRA